MILIGDGGHATDIAATLTEFSHCKHSDDFQGYGPYIIGINDPHVRAKLAEGYGWDDEPWVHPRAFVGPDCEIGAGTHINSDAWVTRARLGTHCTVAPHAVILGDVVIGDRVFVGANATIRNLVTIGDDVTIGMGAVVTKDVTEGQTVAGNPARPI